MFQPEHDGTCTKFVCLTFSFGLHVRAEHFFFAPHFFLLCQWFKRIQVRVLPHFLTYSPFPYRFLALHFPTASVPILSSSVSFPLSAIFVSAKNYRQRRLKTGERSVKQMLHVRKESRALEASIYGITAFLIISLTVGLLMNGLHASSLSTVGQRLEQTYYSTETYTSPVPEFASSANVFLVAILALIWVVIMIAIKRKRALGRYAR